MKILTSTLEGDSLDLTVSECLGVDNFDFDNQHRRGVYHYSTDWQLAGEIMIEHGICVVKDPQSTTEQYVATANAANMSRDENGDVVLAFKCASKGPSPLVAAMRCFVAKQMGDEFDIED